MTQETKLPNAPQRSRTLIYLSHFKYLVLLHQLATHPWWPIVWLTQEKIWSISLYFFFFLRSLSNCNSAQGMDGSVIIWFVVIFPILLPSPLSLSNSDIRFFCPFFFFVDLSLIFTRTYVSSWSSLSILFLLLSLAFDDSFIHVCTDWWR